MKHIEINFITIKPVCISAIRDLPMFPIRFRYLLSLLLKKKKNKLPRNYDDLYLEFGSNYRIFGSIILASSNIFLSLQFHKQPFKVVLKNMF